MTPAHIAIAVPVIVAVLALVGSKFTRRKENADAAKTLVDTAMSMLDELKIDVGVLRGRLEAVEAENARLVTRVATLELDNRNLRSENTGLRSRVGALETQLRQLGHTPIDGHAVVTTSTTETIKTITQGDAA